MGLVGSQDELKTTSSSLEALPFLLITSGIGAYWTAAGGGRVAAAGLALVFFGDLFRLLLRVRTGPFPRPGASSLSSTPFVIFGIVANEGLWRLLSLQPAEPLVEGLRLAAGLYAIAILWSAPPGEKKNIWGRILWLQAGIAQSLILGIPLSWLVRPMSLVAGRPEVAGLISVVAGGLWLLCSARILHQNRVGLRSGIFILMISFFAWLLLGWIWWALRIPVLVSWDVDLRIPAFMALAIASIGTTLHWALVWRRTPGAIQP
ncbi:MAG: hypothetical protein KJ831_04775 [Candidatus Eisenbacteria bacterium]|nr:hypothetical protein [Candidatus Eisenbacteria bacterium]